MPVISIAMTTYNGERFIHKQLQSLLEQTRKPDEVVIFDDCSADDTVGIIHKFITDNELDNWTIISNTKNLGFIKNFNQAIGAAQGDIIFLCDQDDIWNPNKIEKMTYLFEKNPDIKVLSTSFRKIDQYGDSISVKRRLCHSNNNLVTKALPSGSLNKIHFEYIIWRNISPGCTTAFTKECRDFYIENHTDLCPHDWELGIFGAVLDGLYFFNEPLTDYRIYSGNTIGLADIKVNERFRTSIKDPRIESVESEFRRACVYVDSNWYGSLDEKRKRVLIRYRLLTEKRYKMLSEKRLLRWLELLWHLPDYIKLRGLQGIYNDFRYVARKTMVAE